MTKRRQKETHGLSYRLRRSGPESILFIHALGAGRNSFDPCFGLKSFQRYTLGAVDLPGCGGSDPLDDFSYSMKDQAGLVLKWITELGLDRIVLVGHSMGGVIGLYLAESLGQRVEAFFNLEGNLNPSDCMFSGKIASLPLETFEERGFQQFKRTLKENMERDPSPGLENYFENISKVSPRALYLSSLSLVKESANGDLSKRFLNLPSKKWYILGENSVNPETRAFLDENSIPYFIVPESGHFMIDDQPEMFYRILLEALSTKK